VSGEDGTLHDTGGFVAAGDDPGDESETREAPRRLLALVVQPGIPKATDDSSKRDIRELFEKSNHVVAEHFLAQARLRYDDVFKRLENIERRAGTLQTTVVFAATLSLTGGSLLLDRAKVPDAGWRRALAVAVFAAVGAFACSGLHATRAAVRTKHWKVVGKYSLHAQTYKSLADAQRHRAAAYVWCVNHNMSVNKWKSDELDRALWWFKRGLAVLVILAAMVAVYEIL
jgi:hypothetical protein